MLKKLFPGKAILIACMLATMLSCGATITVRIDANGKISFYSGEAMVNTSADIRLQKDETIEFIIDNKTRQKAIVKLLANNNDLLLESVNSIKTDKTGKLSLNNQVLQLGNSFSIICALEGSTEASDIDIQIQRPEPPKDDHQDEKTGEKTVTPAVFLSGCPVTDAIALNTQGSLTKNELVQLFMHYFPGANDQAKIIEAAKQNKFLKDIVTAQLFADAREDDKSGSQSGGKSLLPELSLSGIGGLDVTNIADGFARFIVKRTKEELNIAFFDRMKKDLESEQFKDLRSLFPKTYKLLLTLGSNIYDYRRYLETLRETYKDDMDGLIENLPSIIQNHPAFFEKYKTLAASLNSACYIASELQNHSHPGDILANYPLNYLDVFSSQYPRAAMQTLQLISNSLQKVSIGDNEDYWVDMSLVRKMANDRKTFKIYLGLLLQTMINNYGDITYDGSHSLKSFMNELADHYDTLLNDYTAYKQFILQLAQKTQALNQMIRSYQDIPLRDSASFELYARYFSASVDLLEQVNSIASLPYISTSGIGKLQDTLKIYFEVANTAVDMSLDINRKNYTAAINHAIEIYDLVKNRTAVVDISKKLETVTGRKDRKLYAREIDSLNVTMRRFAHYGTFIASVAETKTSEEVAETIESFALPAGSSRIKKESCWNLSLNAYCGLFAGHESLTNPRRNFKWNAFGMTAPIGFAISKGLPAIKSSVSIFVSLIDLGAVTAFRFENDTTKTLSKIALRDILSPGIYLSIGLPKMPVSLNIGYQITPHLRTVSSAGNTYEANFSRLSIGLCIDLPIFNIYTKTRPGS